MVGAVAARHHLRSTPARIASHPRVGAVSLMVEEPILDESIQHLLAGRAFTAAQALDLWNSQLQTGHFEILGANPGR
jgi:hypothetical protein